MGQSHHTNIFNIFNIFNSRTDISRVGRYFTQEGTHSLSVVEWQC